MTNLGTAGSSAHLFGLRRSSFLDTSNAANNNAINEDGLPGNEPPMDKEVMDEYGARCQAIRTAMMEHAKRVTRDPEEFKHLQARLRGQQQSTTTTTAVMMMGLTDAWLKQNLAFVVCAHARDCELRASARRQVRQTPAACLALQHKQPLHEQQLPGSPMSVLQANTVGWDSVTMKENVGTPPLAPTALFPEEPTDIELLWR